MFFDILGTVLGMFFFGYVVFTVVSFLFDFITGHRLMINVNLNVSLIISIIIAFIFGDLLGRTPDESAYSYLPGLVFMYFFDRRMRLTKKCPVCKERIKLDAVKCKHCSTELEQKEGA